MFSRRLTLLPQAIRQYLIITANYWAFTLTDGALRMLVVLYFYQLGYGPLAIAMLFLFYEFFGVVTNLVGGWLGARLGLNRTMNVGLALQVVALSMLAVDSHYLTAGWVMAAQALSGIAKDLNKMSAKSAIKTLVPKDAQGALYRWVALLTGSKNTLKGVGFFLGGLLLTLLGFTGAVMAMAVGLLCVWLVSVALLKKDLGKSKSKPKFNDIFSKSKAVNILSAARLFLFGARDVWFVVALPVFLNQSLGWDHWQVGSFLACWIIGYGIVQSIAPSFVNGKKQGASVPDGRDAFFWALPLVLIPVAIALGLQLDLKLDWAIELVVLAGLMVFGVVFAVNSALHSFLIVSYASDDGVSLDVGFYYMANAMGRLIGTVLSGALFQWAGMAQAGLSVCLLVSSLFVVLAAAIALGLPKHSEVS
jgi:MFS transporter, APGE family, 1-arseno-3-phosphoglycerate exporter